MILYHGSKGKYDVLKRSQAQKAEGIEVPEKELKNAIYVSSNYAFTLAMCSMPSGLTHVDIDKMTIETEHPENFDPDEKVYIYEIDLEKIPKDKIEFIDEMQGVVDLDELNFESRQETVAREVLKHFKLLGIENRENTRELRKII